MKFSTNFAVLIGIIAGFTFLFGLFAGLGAESENLLVFAFLFLSTIGSAAFGLLSDQEKSGCQ